MIADCGQHAFDLVILALMNGHDQLSFGHLLTVICGDFLSFTMQQHTGLQFGKLRRLKRFSRLNMIAFWDVLPWVGQRMQEFAIIGQ